MNILIFHRSYCQFDIIIIPRERLQMDESCRYDMSAISTWEYREKCRMSRRCGWSDTKVGNARETCTFIPEDILHKQKQHMAATSDKRNVEETVPMYWEISWKRHVPYIESPSITYNFRYVGRQSLQLRWLRWHRVPRSD